jgi:hypothetical protein
MEHHHEGLAADLARLLDTATSRRQSLRWLMSGMAALPLARQQRRELRRHPRGDRRAVSGRRHQQQRQRRRQCADAVRHRAQRHPLERGRRSGRAHGRAADDPAAAGERRRQLRAAAGATVYLWHCDRDGNYSMYSSGMTPENYLRGVQEADADGVVTFTTIFPGCYDGRMPHVHFEVYPTLAKAASAANRIKTSQFTFPMAT